MATKNARKSKTKAKTRKERAVFVPATKDLAVFEGKAEPLDVDTAAHIKWLETGEGEPWPPGSSS